MADQPPKLISLRVYIRDADKILFDGEVKAISFTNEMGVFDILPLHQNFISIVKEKLILHHQEGRKEEINIGGGVIKVYKNSVNVFLGIEKL